MKLQDLYEVKERGLIGRMFNGTIVTPEMRDVKWYQDFNCSSSKLNTLNGCPHEIHGTFDCSDNNLKTLIGGPTAVYGTFRCSKNKLTTLKGAPKKVTADFWCQYNKFKSLVGAPERVNGTFSCSNNNLTSLVGAPKYVGKNFNMSNTLLKSLKDIHKHIEYIGRGIMCYDNKIDSHVLGLLLINGLQDISCNGIWAEILNKHLGKGKAGVLAAQQELIEAGLEEYAQL